MKSEWESSYGEADSDPPWPRRLCMRGGGMEEAADRNPPFHRLRGPKYYGEADSSPPLHRFCGAMHSIMSVAYSYKPNE